MMRRYAAVTDQTLRAGAPEAVSKHEPVSTRKPEGNCRWQPLLSASQTVSIAGSRPAAKGPAEYLTDNARIDPLFATKDVAPVTGAYLTFEPGARSAWHTIPRVST